MIKPTDRAATMLAEIADMPWVDQFLVVFSRQPARSPSELRFCHQDGCRHWWSWSAKIAGTTYELSWEDRHNATRSERQAAFTEMIRRAHEALLLNEPPARKRQKTERLKKQPTKKERNHEHVRGRP